MGHLEGGESSGQEGPPPWTSLTVRGSGKALCWSACALQLYSFCCPNPTLTAKSLTFPSPIPQPGWVTQVRHSSQKSGTGIWTLSCGQDQFDSN